MAVANGTNSASSALSGTAGSVVTASITAPNTNPVILVHIAMLGNNSVASVVTGAGLGSVSGTLVLAAVGSLGNEEVWVIKAPTPGGSATVTITFNGTPSFQYSWSTFSGADQTTPCPVADAVSSVASVASPQTFTPANLTANDASFGGAASFTGDPTSVTPNQTYLDNITSVNMESGYATGTTGITSSHDDGTQLRDYIAVRIVAAAGSQEPGPDLQDLTGAMLGM
jgi:hypothetical protein